MDQLKIIERKLIHDGTVLRYYSDKIQLPDGNRETWDMVEHKFNASAIIPVLPDGRILLVSQYRSTADRITWEIPAGKKDPGEDYLTCAKRELLEETGYSSEKLKHLFTFRCAIAYSSEVVKVYKAEDVKKVSEQNLDPSEYINVKAWELPRLLEMISGGTLQDSKTIAAVYAIASER